MSNRRCPHTIWLIFWRAFIGLFVIVFFIEPVNAFAEPFSEKCTAAISSAVSARTLIHNSGRALLEQGMLLSDASFADRGDRRLQNDASISKDILGYLVANELAITALGWGHTFKLRMNLLMTVKKGKEKDLGDFDSIDQQSINLFGARLRESLKTINQTLLLDIYNVGFRRSIEDYRGALQSYINQVSPCF
jgi:hypothetical protein